MRLNINLASQPYEAARRYRQRMTAVIAALGLAAAVLLGYIVYQRVHSRTILRQLAEVQGQIDGLDHEEAQARAILNKPANRVVADQSDFLNELFARKALSWTRIFTEMESVTWRNPITSGSRKWWPRPWLPIPVHKRLGRATSSST